jgi:hypothetical protein
LFLPHLEGPTNHAKGNAQLRLKLPAELIVRQSTVAAEGGRTPDRMRLRLTFSPIVLVIVIDLLLWLIKSGGKTSTIGEAHPVRQSIYLIPVLE